MFILHLAFWIRNKFTKEQRSIIEYSLRPALVLKYKHKEYWPTEDGVTLVELMSRMRSTYPDQVRLAVRSAFDFARNMETYAGFPSETAHKRLAVSGDTGYYVVLFDEGKSIYHTFLDTAIAYLKQNPTTCYIRGLDRTVITAAVNAQGDATLKWEKGLEEDIC